MVAVGITCNQRLGNHNLPTIVVRSYSLAHLSPCTSFANFGQRIVRPSREHDVRATLRTFALSRIHKIAYCTWGIFWHLQVMPPNASTAKTSSLVKVSRNKACYDPQELRLSIPFPLLRSSYLHSSTAVCNPDVETQSALTYLVSCTRRPNPPRAISLSVRGWY